MHDDMDTQILKFQNALITVFQRWLEESDLDNHDMAKASVDVINSICDDDAITFESDILFDEDQETDQFDT